MFLLLVAVIMVAVLFLPFWNKIDIDTMEAVKLNAFTLNHVQIGSDESEIVMASKPTYWISVLAILAAGVALFSIFQYKNRLLQMKLGALNSLIMAGSLGFSYYYSTVGDKLVKPETIGQFQIGFYIIAAALLFNSLANRFIRRDDRLVKSADRIR